MNGTSNPNAGLQRVNLEVEELAQEKHRLVILIVEDDPDDLYLIRQYLSEDYRRTYELHSQNSLSAALIFLKSHQVDLVLLDLGLPDSEGLESLQILVRENSDMPIVVLTGVHDDEVGEQAIKNGAEDYLPKALANSFMLKRSISYAVERHRLMQEIRKRAEQDPLTGLPNRSMIYDKLEFMITQSERSGHPFALVMADLDKFKQVNDTRGHRFGDQLLKAFAKRLQKLMRKSDYVSRYGGDEFIMIVSNYSSRNELYELMQEKQKALSAPYLVEHDQELVELNIGVSLGITEWECGETPGAMLEKADRRMYRNKRR